MMKHLFYLLWLGIALLCYSCQSFSHENNGYPASVTFPQDGGVIRISGNQSLMYIVIDEEDGHLGSATKNDSNYLNFKWLSVKWKEWDNEIILTAEPNQEKKNRKIKLYGYMGHEYAEITVKQKH